SVDLERGEEIKIEAVVYGTAPVRRVSVFRDGCLIGAENFTDGDKELLEVSWRGSKGTGRDKVVDWSGGLSLKGGCIADVEGFGFHHPDQGIKNIEPTTVTWDATTTGNHQGIRVKLKEIDQNAVIEVNTEPITIDIPFADLQDGEEHTVEVPEKLDASLSVRRTGSATQSDVTASFEDELPKEDAVYYVRVTQDDGEMAWSSPTFCRVR
ncbi:MAG: hypothetical protein SV377_02730, partial [Halobacteria archaeon]|nr:hypothetical protein [Halobacteria archaeon]